MGQKRSRAASRGWRILRIALLWARKGGILKCRLMAELKHIKALHRHSSSVIRRRIDSAAVYGEQELSFDETRILRLGMSHPGSLRFKLPYINPSVVDFDYDFGEEIYAGRTSLLESESGEVDEDEGEDYDVGETDFAVGSKGEEEGD